MRFNSENRRSSIAAQSFLILIASNALAWVLTGLLIAAVANPVVLRPALRMMMRSRLADVRPLLRPSVQVGNWPLIRTVLAAANESPLALSQVFVVQRETGMLLPEQFEGGSRQIGAILGSPYLRPAAKDEVEALDDEDASRTFHAEWFFPADRVTGFNPLLVVITNRSVILRRLTLAIWILGAIGMAGTAVGGLTQFVLIRRRVSAPIADLAKALENERPTRLSDVAYPRVPGVAEVDQIRSAVRGLLQRIDAEQSRRSELEAENRVLERDAAIARTTQMLAHDVRKPFTLLRMIMGMLRDARDMNEVNESVREFLPEVDGALASVNGMIQDVIEIGSERPPTLAAVRPEELVVAALAELFAPRVDTNVAFEYDLRHEYSVAADRLKVQRVFLNILGNAVEAMKAKGKVWIHTREVIGDSGRFVEFCLGNSGTFIEEADVPKLFDAFFTKGKVSGTGLGLAIARKIITAHNGRIWCRSSRAVGVEFLFTLPCTWTNHGKAEVALPRHSRELERVRQVTGRESSEDAEVEHEALRRIRALGRPTRVLIVDDESVYINALTSFVSRGSPVEEACQVASAVDARQATAVAEQIKPDLVILDVDLEFGQDGGYTVARQLRVSGQDAIICMHSNRNQISDHRAAIAAGADAFMPKPMSRAHFLRLLAQAAEKACEGAQRPASVV